MGLNRVLLLPGSCLLRWKMKYKWVCGAWIQAVVLFYLSLAHCCNICISKVTNVRMQCISSYFWSKLSSGVRSRNRRKGFSVSSRLSIDAQELFTNSRCWRTSTGPFPPPAAPIEALSVFLAFVAIIIIDSNKNWLLCCWTYRCPDLPWLISRRVCGMRSTRTAQGITRKKKVKGLYHMHLCIMLRIPFRWMGVPRRLQTILRVDLLSMKIFWRARVAAVCVYCCSFSINQSLADIACRNKQ